MKNSAQLRADIEALQAELKTVTERENETAKKAAAVFTFDYDWSINWPHPAQFRVERTATAETMQRVEAFRAEFPTYSYSPKPFEGGMTYSVLIGNDGKFYVHGGGGSVIINPSGKTNKYPSSFDPEPISEKWLNSLRIGVIPEGMKK